MQRRPHTEKRGNIMVNTEVHISGLMLENPIIPASGTFGYGREFAELYDINILGSIALKGTTMKRRYGNEGPRIAECERGMLNSVGLQNPGVDAVTDEEIPALSEVFTKKVIANVCGFSIEEYALCAEKISRSDKVGIIEVNISCPNVSGGGMAFGTSPEAAGEVTKAVKAVSKKPVYMKLSPNVTDIAAIAKACEKAGADGLSLINTLAGMRVDIKKRKPVLTNKSGGLSGPAIFPIALKMVHDTAKAVNIPVMGIGGISRASEVLEMIMAGAHAVQIGTANLIDPWVCRKIIEELPALMERSGIDDLDGIRGAAWKKQ